MHPMPLRLGQECLSAMQDSVNRMKEAGLPDITAALGVDLTPVHEFQKRCSFSMDEEAAMENAIFRVDIHVFWCFLSTIRLVDEMLYILHVRLFILVSNV
ncbi:ubiquinone biosynthesis protein [Histoplasma ohiense]|nr:ubiquinone biosynthesis protein [Histoplasma ohiense (nom. inval.)]